MMRRTHSSSAAKPTRKSRLKRFTMVLLNGCAHSALLLVQVVAPLGVVLPSTVHADTLGLPGSIVSGIILTNYPGYNTFYVGAGTTIQNTNQQAGNRSTGLYGDATQVWTLTNVGTITNKYDVGIQPVGVLFEAGGTIINNGRISGNFSTGIEINGGPGKVTNTGVVYGYYTGISMSAGGTITNTSSGSILTDRNPLGAGYHAISIQGASGAVINAGSINGVYAVQLTAGGTVTNQAGGLITSQRIGVDISGAAGTITNSGTITATAAGSGTGVYLRSGGTITNNATGTITAGSIGIRTGGAGSIVNAGKVTGSTYGVVASASGVTLTNSGTISGTGTGIDMTAGGGVTNSATGIISGSYGIKFSGAAASTLTNAGTIIGNGGTAVRFSSGSDRLVLQSGASFAGKVDGGSGSNTIELAAGAGNLAAFGSSFVNFGSVLVDSGASWTLTGATTIANGVTVTSSGTLLAAGTLTNASTITGSGIALSVASASSAVINNSGKIAGTLTGIDVAGFAVISNTGNISGVTGYGVRFTGTSSNTLTNSGTISGSTAAIQFGSGNDKLTLLAGAVLSGLVDGGTGLNTLTLGTGTGSLTGLGTSFTNFGQVTVSNDGVWALTGSNTVAAGVTLTNNGSLSSSGSLINNGSISGGLSLSGTATNAGIISGAVNGIDGSLGLSGIINTGRISGAGIGVYLAAGGIVGNSGTISGTGTAGIGVRFADNGSYNNTLINSGAIIGNGGTAVQFGAGNDLLVLQSGASFTGAVNGGAGTNTLELGAGSGTGTVTGLGTSFVNFGAVDVAATAVWNLTGGNTITSQMTLTSAGVVTSSGSLDNIGTLDTSAGTLTNTGLLTNSGSILGAVTLTSAGTLSNSGTIGASGGPAVLFASDGTLTNTASGLISGTTAGVHVTGGTAMITNSGTIMGTGVSGVGILFSGSGQGTIDNFGMISGAGGTAVQFAGGTNELIIESGGGLSGIADGSNGINTLILRGTGSLSNAQIIGFQSASLVGAAPVIDSATVIENATIGDGTSSTSLTNQGTLTGTLVVTTTGTIANNGTIALTSGSTNSGTIVNDAGGSLTNTAALTNNGSLINDGSLNNDGSVSNIGLIDNRGVITGTQAISTSGSFVNIGSVTGDTDGLIGSGIITNSGTIIGTTGTGVDLTAGTLTNAVGGFIQGGEYGAMVGSGGTVINAGTILDNAIAGIALSNNATVINNATGTIGGITGAVFTGTGASIVNRGTITGTGGVAVQFDAGVNDLTLDTGSILNGAIDGGGGAGRITLSGSGTLGNTISGFGAGSTLTIAAGADWTASGSWTIASVTNAGTLQAGTLTTPLQLSGNFVQSSSGTFQVIAGADGRSSRLQAGGTATLNGGSVAVVAGTGSYRPSTTYTILTSTGLSGRFASVSSDLAFLTPTLSYDANNAYIALATKTGTGGGTLRFASVANTANQAHTADAIQSGGLYTALYDAIIGQSDAGARQAFDALSGEAYGSVNSTLLSDSTMIPQAILERLRQATYDQADGAMAALGSGGPTTIDPTADALGYAETQLQSASAAAAERMGTTASVKRPDAAFSSIAAWGEAFGGWGRLDGNGNAASAHQSRGGFIVGVDSEIGDDWRAGIAGGITSTNLDVDGRSSSTDIDSYNLALYAGRSFDAVNLRFGGAYGWQSVSMNRRVTFQGFDERLGSDYDARTGQLFGELGYSVNWQDIAFEPFAGASYVHLDTDSAHESGGAAALNLHGDSFGVGFTTIGVRLGTVWSLGDSTSLTPRVSLAWQHTVGSVNPAADLSFSSGDPFDVTGAPMARDAALVEAGATLAIRTNISFGLSYKGTLSQHTQDQEVKGNLTWKF